MTDRSAGPQAGARPPLDGVRVLDFTHVVAGPYCTMMLADMGADVVKVENPRGGDDLRRVQRYPGRSENDEDYFYALNRRKRSIAVDLKDPDERELMHRLAARADVVLQNFAPGRAESLGIGPFELRAHNPRLVYCAISGFGDDGPLRDRLALDSIIQAMSGVKSVTGDPDGPPMGVGAPIADVVAAMFAAYAVVCAVTSARETGVGAYIDISMLESMIAVLGPRMAEALQGSRQPARVGNGNPMRVPAGMYKAADGQYVQVIAPNQGFWGPFCRALGRPEWADDPRFATMRDRIANRDALEALVSEQMLERPAAEWIDRLVAQRVPCGPVYDYRQVVSDPHVTQRGLIVEVDHPRSGPIKLVGPPWKTTMTSPELRPPPLLGEHRQDVLDDWLADAGR